MCAAFVYACNAWYCTWHDINGLVQDCSNSSALAMELLQSCIKPSIWAQGGEEHYGGGVEAETRWRPLWQTTFPYVISSIKCFNFNKNFTELCSWESNWHNWFRWWIGVEQATSQYLIQWWPRRVYASSGLNELKPWCLKSSIARLFFQQLVEANSNKYIDIIACIKSPIARSSVQRKTFHIMISSRRSWETW